MRLELMKVKGKIFLNNWPLKNFEKYCLSKEVVIKVLREIGPAL